MEDSIAIALDLGTTSIKGGVLRNDGVLDPVFIELAPVVVQTGDRFESNALEYLQLCQKILTQIIGTTSTRLPLGLSLQRSSFVIWDSTSGNPVSPLISWQDSRAESLCRTLKSKIDQIQRKTGLRLTPYFFAPKLSHVLKENPQWTSGLEQGVLLVGTLDSFIIWHWTEPRIHQTDLSMAARTLLVEIECHHWSPELAELFSVSTEYLPSISYSEGFDIPLRQGINLKSSVADQSAAMIALAHDHDRTALVNLGTGGFVCTWLNEVDRSSRHQGYQTTLVYQDSNLTTYYALEGTINSIGPALSKYAWLNFTLCEDQSLSDIYSISEPSGLGAPFYRDDIKMQFSKSISHLDDPQIAQLVLQGVVFRVKQILDDFTRICGVDTIYLAGGWSRLPALQQSIAQLCGESIYLLEEKESSLLGAAQLASPKKTFPPVKRNLLERPKGHEFLTDKYNRWRRWLDQLLCV